VARRFAGLIKRIPEFLSGQAVALQ
jgi:hypothetical protein